MKLVVIIDSIRKDSYNLKLAKYVQRRYASRFDLEILSIHDLPFYNPDIENNTSAAVDAFRQKVADAVLWVTAEYNYSIPGVLKNAIDWLSRGNRVMNGKPSWIMGASGSTLGSVRAQLHLREILFSPGINSPLLPSNEVYVSSAQYKCKEVFKNADWAWLPFGNRLDRVGRPRAYTSVRERAFLKIDGAIPGYCKLH